MCVLDPLLVQLQRERGETVCAVCSSSSDISVSFSLLDLVCAILSFFCFVVGGVAACVCVCVCVCVWYACVVYVCHPLMSVSETHIFHTSNRRVNQHLHAFLANIVSHK